MIIHEIERFCREHPSFNAVPSLGRYFYHGILALIGQTAGACVGNSSSGIKETLSFSCPAINIGSRQRNRLRGSNVIDVDYDSEKIYQACQRAITDKEFIAGFKASPNPYGNGNAGLKIAKILAETKLDLDLLNKKMTY